MKRKTTTALVAVGLLFLAVLPPGPGVVASAPPADRPAVRPPVIAFTEGINVYHMTFREPTWTAHPSTYIPGYPSDARPLVLSLHLDEYDEAVAADAAVWASVQPGQLYYVPGTRVVGMITPNDYQGLVDESNGHGTAVADAGAGSFNGVNPDAAIVAAVNFAQEPTMDFIVESEWIDVVTNSQGCIISRPGDIHQPFPVIGTLHWQSQATATWQLAEEGRLSFNAAGNGQQGATNAWCESMPPWVVVVGDWNSGSDDPETCTQCDHPYEIVARGTGCLAEGNSISGSGSCGSGTSIASPRAAAYASQLIQDARLALGDMNGFRNGAYALGPPLPGSGPLSDGRLTALEVQDLLRRTAMPGQVKNLTAGSLIPGWQPQYAPEQLSYALQGYGAVNDTSFARARAVLLGEATLAERPWDDYWHAHFDGIAGAFWYTMVCRGLSPPEGVARCAENLERAYSHPLVPPV